MSASDRAALPAVGTTTIGGTDYLTMTYRQNYAITGITVSVQTSPTYRRGRLLRKAKVFLRRRQPM